MDELELVGLHEDEEHVVLTASDGTRYRLRIDEALRAAVRRDRPQLEQLRTQGTGLSPKEIQAHIRSGMSAEELVEVAGLTLEYVRRFEGPVLAERGFIAEQARATRVGRDPDAPELGDLVTDRLAARGVAPEEISWDAYRPGPGPWTVVVRFQVAGSPREAQWSFDVQARALHALEDEARWLSETELHDEPIPRRHLSAVRDVLYDIEADGGVRPLGPLEAPVVEEPAAATTAEDETAALLDGLREQRGRRQPLDPEGSDEADPLLDQFEGFGPQHAFDFSTPPRGSDTSDLGYDTPALPGLEPPGDIPAAHPPVSRPEQATDAAVIELPDSARTPAPAEPAARDERAARGDHAAPVERTAPAAQGQDAPADGPAPAGEDRAPEPPRRTRKGRASVPSWDEIVFGAKPE